MQNSPVAPPKQASPLQSAIEAALASGCKLPEPGRTNVSIGDDEGFNDALDIASQVVARCFAEAGASVDVRPLPLQFPAMLRKMWTGGEVQAWLDTQRQLTL